MKSAYELALERMESQGIERPRSDSLTDDERQQVADLRSRAEAKIAELEILLRQKASEPGASAEDRQQAEQEFQAERRRIEDARDAKIRKLRGS